MSNDDPLVYLGPNSPKLGLHRLQYYTALPTIVTDAIAANPALNLLIIPLSQFAGIRSEVLAGINPSINHAIEHLTSAGVF